MSNSLIKFYYFPVNAKGCVIRALLNHGKYNYKEINPRSDPNWKQNPIFEFGQVPVLEIDGKNLTQSYAIEKYLSQKLDLYGKNIDENYQIDSLALAILTDFHPKYAIWLFTKNEYEKGMIEKNKNDFKNVWIPFYLTKFEQRFKATSKKYFIGDRLSLADFYVGIHLNRILMNKYYLNEFGPLFKNIAPKLYEHCQKLKENELKDYFNKIHLLDNPL
jgi:glutathione S-transferase